MKNGPLQHKKKVVMMIKHWTKLSRESVESLSLEIFPTNLMKAMASLPS